MNLFKKLNWNSFTFIFLLTALGLGTNKSLQHIADWVIMLLIIGVPLGLLFAWMGKED